VQQRAGQLEMHAQVVAVLAGQLRERRGGVFGIEGGGLEGLQFDGFRVLSDQPRIQRRRRRHVA